MASQWYWNNTDVNQLWLFVDYHRRWELSERHWLSVSSIDLMHLSHLFFIAISDPLIHSSHLIQKNATVGVFKLHFQFKGCSILRFHLNGLEIMEILDELNQRDKKYITIGLQICASSHEHVKAILRETFCHFGSSLPLPAPLLFPSSSQPVSSACHGNQWCHTRCKCVHSLSSQHSAAIPIQSRQCHLPFSPQLFYQHFKKIVMTNMNFRPNAST